MIRRRAAAEVCEKADRPNTVSFNAVSLIT